MRRHGGHGGGVACQSPGLRPTFNVLGILRTMHVCMGCHPVTPVHTDQQVLFRFRHTTSPRHFIRNSRVVRMSVSTLFFASCV